MDEKRPTPGYWVRQLADLTLRGRNLDDIATELTSYDDLSATDVLTAFRAYYDTALLISLVVVPQESAAPQSPGD